MTTISSGLPMMGPRSLAAWSAAVTGVAGLVLLVGGQSAYVDRIAPIWTPVLGSFFALVCTATVRYRRAAGVAATVFLLPSAIAGIFHVMRALGAIPLPVDWWALVTSIGAVATLWATWRLSHPLQGEDGLPLDTPRWIATIGILAALIYPAIKTSWVAGSTWLAPRGVGHELDAAYVVPVVLALSGSAATVVALRWWNRPSPRWAHHVAAAGGLALTGLGVSGVNATVTNSPPEGPVLGILVYGGWALWGLATLAVAARLSPRRVAVIDAVASSA